MSGLLEFHIPAKFSTLLLRIRPYAPIFPHLIYHSCLISLCSICVQQFYFLLVPLISASIFTFHWSTYPFWYFLVRPYSHSHITLAIFCLCSLCVASVLTALPTSPFLLSVPNSLWQLHSRPHSRRLATTHRDICTVPSIPPSTLPQSHLFTTTVPQSFWLIPTHPQHVLDS